MMSTDIAVVVVLMVLRTAAYPGTTIETTTETTTGTPPPTPPPPTVCPVMLSCTGNCNLDYSNMEDGCPTCLCDEATCEVMRNCGPDEVCGSNDENPYDIICVSKYGTTTETTTETTIHRPTCRPIPCNYPQCDFDYDSDGCAICVCPNCEFVICPPDEYCVEKNENQCQGGMCYSCVSISGTTTETTTETTTWRTSTRPVCTYRPCAELGYCGLDYTYLTDGCPTCVCWDSTPKPTTTTQCPIADCFLIDCRTVPGSDGCLSCDCSTYNCDNVTCGPDQECAMQNIVDCYYPWCPPEPTCVPLIYATTTETPTETTTETNVGTPLPPVCPDVSSCDTSTYCYLDYTLTSDGCPTCVCSPKTRVTPQFCPDMSWCDGSSNCNLDYTYLTNGCPTCMCSDPICGWLVQCGPDEECLPSDEDPLGYACFSIHDTTTTTPNTPTATTPCPTPPCARGCHLVPGTDACYFGCNCPDSTCEETTCAPGQVCVMQSDECPEEETSCFRWPTCVSSTDTTTTIPNRPTPTATTPCPIPPCAVGCRLVPGPVEGCYIGCTCPDRTCEETTCDPGQVCVMQSDECPEEETSCFRWPTCVPSTVSTTPTTTPSVTPTVWCPTVTCNQGCQIATDYSGCTYCDCPPSCENVSCAEGEKCELFPTPCAPSPYPCHPQPVCVSITETTTSCPQIRCAPPCVSDTGSDGCPTCACPSSCQGYNCSDGYECQLVDVPCKFVGPCFPEPQCVPIQETTTLCPTIECAPECVADNGTDGCPTCECPPSCQTVKCSDGYECQLVNVTCFRYPCFPQPQCVPTEKTTTPCPTIECAPGCVPDNGTDGCPTCACPPSCQTVKCSAGYECQLVNVTCFRYPCFPEAQCVPTENPCRGTPNPRRCGRSNNRWTYKSVTDTCEIFKYYGCTPTRNTFLSPEACKNKCKGGAQSICEDVACENNCYTYTRKNKCPKCVCPNPCEGYQCHYGDECKLQEAKGEDEDPEPFCAPKP